MVVAAASGLALWLVVALQRRKRDLREYLEPALQKCGVEFLSAAAPGLFRTGPFPKFEVEARPQSSIADIQGSYDEYRIVKFRDAAGRVQEIWAIVEFNNFHFSRIRWRAEQKDRLPPSILAILEN